jgi:hypothetical protein
MNYSFNLKFQFLFSFILMIIYNAHCSNLSVIERISNEKKNNSKCVIYSEQYSNEYVTVNQSIRDKISANNAYLAALSRIENLNDIAHGILYQF